MGRAEFEWDPSDQFHRGPCMRVVVMNSHDVIEGWRALGLDCPDPRSVTALIDTGASVTVISRVFANYCRLFQTSEGSELTTLGATLRCGEHAGAISFPDTTLRPIDSLRIVSADFVGQRNYSCLIGRDVLQNWRITFDGPGKRVTIED
jgi:hypothetical protein